MVFLKWIVFGLISVPATIIAKAFCWVLPFFVDEETKRLPNWLSWFMTPNTDADGDPAHWERHPGTDWWSTFKRRTAWFWRNSLYGFDRQVLGIDCKTTDVLDVQGNPFIGRRPFVPGWCYRRLYRNEKFIAFQFYFVVSWPFGLFESRCWRGNLGWKLWDFSYEKEKCCMWTGMINPFFHKE